MNEKVLVIAAHIGDFVWRSGGAIAKYVKEGAEVELIVLTYGLRGESNAYWKRPDATLKEAREIRRAEGFRAAEILGISRVEVCDYEDYPICLDRHRMEVLAGKIREFVPDIIITHDRKPDLYNADHALVGEKILEICSMASAAGAAINGCPPVKRPVIYGFEPHVAEVSGFLPEIYIDITDVMEKKKEAMSSYSTQKNMFDAYINRGRVRAQQTGKPGCQYAEAFSMHRYLTKQEFFLH